MVNLNIIGNGFDLYHGLPTSYYFFACYFLKNHEETYYQLASMYGLSKGIYSYPSDELTLGIDDVGFWSDFEKNLAILASDWVENSLLDDLDLEFSDPPVTLEIDRPNIATDIKRILFNWIRDTVDKDEVYEIVDRHIETNKVKFQKNDYFISFNYTHTLEKLYEKKEIFHIHGECCDDNDDELIIGHGSDKEILRLRSKISELDNDTQFYQTANNRVQEYSFEIDILESLRKPVSKCKSALANELSYYTKPDFIRVYGCSLGEVDIPYMKLVHEKWPDVKWSFSYYSRRDVERVSEATDKIGLKEDQWTLFELKNALSLEIQREIVYKEKIVTYPTVDELLKKNK